jgi:hypothetical protein
VTALRLSLAIVSLFFAFIALPARAQIDPSPGAHEWTAYDGGDFTVTFPYSGFMMTAPLVQMEGIYFAATSIGPPSSGYSVTTFETRETLNEIQREAIILQIAGARLGLEVEYEQEIALGDMRGREIYGRVDGNWLRQRVYWVESNFYVLSVQSPERNGTRPEADQFFESFRPR